MTVSFYPSLETFSAVLTKIQVGQNPNPCLFVSLLDPAYLSQRNANCTIASEGMTDESDHLKPGGKGDDLR